MAKTPTTTEKAEAHTAEQSAKHTPGPWFVNTGTTNGRADDQIYSDKDNRTPIAKVIHRDGLTVSEIHANARLIAKAPELFAMVQDYAENADCGNGGEHDEVDNDKAANCWHCKAVALVAEVEGRAL